MEVGTIQQGPFGLGELTQDEARFLSRANCLASIGHLLAATYEGDVHHGLAAATAQRVRVKRRRELTGRSRQLLRVAWQTELAARFGSAFEDVALKRVGAQTLPVNAYYAMFNGLRTLSIVRVSPTETHRAVHDGFAKAAHLLPLPWSVLLAGNPDDPADCVLSPKHLFEPYPFNPLERAHPPEAHLWAALRMTRRWKFDLARKDWLRHNKKRDGTPYRQLPPGRPAELARALRPTSLLDFLYELRRRANYETADEYGAEVTNEDVARFHEGMIAVLDSGMLIIETRIAAHVGWQSLASEVARWQKSVGRVGAWATRPLQLRAGAIERALASS